ncbi:hypothetical protein D9758_011026 [Tetrapyrgos nigripes]|uniref:EthD domain-containing protein n=1 Tax=Tetrapyrgos nigripes TaxID=182062 RepID=A0A8H5GHY3_9AGAR|nr:hypothetical protein D9758_011026 [Tetrapyrgos nigripes]
MSTPTLRADRVRLLSLIKQNPSISREEFDRYWLEHHSQLFLSLDIVKRNILKYEQLHVNQKTRKLFQSLGVASIDCDGAALFEAESYEKIFELINDSQFQAIAIPDEEKFIDRSKTRMIPLDFVGFLDK